MVVPLFDVTFQILTLLFELTKINVVFTSQIGM